jgi:hypothetical protein
MEPVTVEEYQEAIVLSAAVLRWVEQLLGSVHPLDATETSSMTDT